MTYSVKFRHPAHTAPLSVTIHGVPNIAEAERCAREIMREDGIANPADYRLVSIVDHSPLI